MATFGHPKTTLGGMVKTVTVKDLKTWLGSKNWRTTKATRCATCKTLIVAGLDADTCAFIVQADPTPLDATGEALALLAGLHTYTAHRTNKGAVQLTRRCGRWPTIIRSAHDVWPEHRCNHTHTHTTQTKIDLANRTGRPLDDDQPPF